MNKAPISAPDAAPDTDPAEVAPAPQKPRSEKALRLAAALRDNLRRRKAAARPARPSN